MENAVTIVSGNKVYRPLLDPNLVADDLRVAREELNETPETREAAFKLLKEMLEAQKEFTSRTDDDFLLRFLRCRKFNCKNALRMIRDYYKFRKQNPGIYPSPRGIEAALRAHIFNFLPHRDHKGRTISILKFDRWEPDKVSFTDFLAVGNLVSEYTLENYVTQINGFIGVWDYEGFAFKHFKAFCNPMNCLVMANLMQDRFPGRFKIAYCVNCSSLVSAAWCLIRPMMKEKFKQRVKLLSSLKELHQYVDRSILPKEYGGTLAVYDTEEIVQRVLDKEQYINLNLKFGF